FGKQYFVNLDLQKKSFCEANIPLMQRESLLTDEYQKIMAGCEIEFKGEKLNLYGIQKYFEDEDREVRKAAFKAYSDFYHDNEPRLEEIWDELIRIRNEMGVNLGFDNYIPLGYMTQGRTDYGETEVASFRDQVKEELVPLCEKLYEAQAKRLGIDKIMAFDEKRVFPDGNAVPAGDDDFMIATAQKMYHEISPETGEFIDFMIDHNLLDLKNKPGKASTGYMTSLPVYKAPFVFSCFNHTIFDMQVLSHELGHAFAGYEAMREQPITDYYSESTDIAEIHSMTMEQFAYPYIEWFFGKDADKYRFQHLQEALTFVPFGVAVDEFQHICYAHPELTPKERTYEWHKLEEKYMPWRTYENDEFMERGGYWYHKLHIYLYPFYYINYTLTTMGAMEFKKKMAEDHDAAWADYLKLCKCGGSMSYLETLKYANVSNPFEPGSVKRSIEYAKDILLKEIEKN
ncbi:MAG: M3 family oligoendopeptidase, partial [Lachnospiraceae bacterium]|nr:M3 family oligoendopeptidase [Lachnospiraceae bacterium]